MSFFARDGAGDLLARYSFIEPLLAGRRVLEVGGAAATAGASALFLAERGAAAVVSVEAEPEALEEAVRESQHPFVQFKVASPETLPERAFDLVLYADGAGLATDPVRLAAVVRLLAPRGRLVTAAPAAGGLGLSELAGEPPLEEPPSFESFVGALGDHFPSVEVATQSATVGYVIAMGQEAEPEVSIDGSLAGTSETASYVAVCGEAACGLQGLNIVALPTQPLFELAAERERLAASGGAAADEARGERDAALAEAEEARSARDAARAELEAAHQELARRDEELKALNIERPALMAERDAIAEARAELERANVAQRAELRAAAERIQALEHELDEEREAAFELRAVADKLPALEAQREKERGEAVEAIAAREADAARAGEEKAQALAEASGLRERAGEAEAALQGARSEAQAARTALEAALARATAAEGRVHELEERSEAQTTAVVRLTQLEEELVAVRAESAALAAERDALRDRAEGAREAQEQLQSRVSELDVRAGEVDRLTAELSRRDDAVAEATAERDTLTAQLAEMGARVETGEERLRAAEAQASEARAQAEAERHEAERLRDALHETEARAALAAEARGSADQAEAQAAELEAELQAVRWEKDELEQRLQAAAPASTAGEVARLREEVALRTHRIVELEKEVVRLGAVLAEFTSGPSVGTPGPARAPAAAPGDAVRIRELELQLAEAEERAAVAEQRANDRTTELPVVVDEASDTSEVLDRLQAERDSLEAQVVDRDAKLARLQREVLDKTERLGRLAKEMGELKAKGIGKLFK